MDTDGDAKFAKQVSRESNSLYYITKVTLVSVHRTTPVLAVTVCARCHFPLHPTSLHPLGSGWCHFLPTSHPMCSSGLTVSCSSWGRGVLGGKGRRSHSWVRHAVQCGSFSFHGVLLLWILWPILHSTYSINWSILYMSNCSPMDPDHKISAKDTKCCCCSLCVSVMAIRFPPYCFVWQFVVRLIVVIVS